MKLLTWSVSSLLLATGFAVTMPASAGISIGGTRIIYNAENKETSLSIKNPASSGVYLVQSWIESGSHSATAPFIVTPPLYRSEPGKENILRIISTHPPAAENKESLYWLNVKSIPATDSERDTHHALQMVVKSRLKVFYRPDGIKGRPEEAYKQLQFTRHGKQLHVTNPTGYYVTFYSLKANGVDVKKADMVPPFGQVDYALPVANASSVSWQAINDFGGMTQSARQDI